MLPAPPIENAPAIEIVAPESATRTNGPAGRFSGTTVEPAVNERLTGPLTVLISKLAVPPLTVTPGSAIVKVMPVNDAARPAEVTRIAPSRRRTACRRR